MRETLSAPTCGVLSPLAEQTGFSLTDNEGGGGYVRTDAEVAEPQADDEFGANG